MLTDLYLSLHASGSGYTPSKIRFRFTKQHDPEDIAGYGIYKGSPWGTGYSKIEVPSSVPFEERITYLSQVAAPLIDRMRTAGATDLYVKADFFCESSCDFLLETAELKALADLRCDVSVSCEILNDGKKG